MSGRQTFTHRENADDTFDCVCDSCGVIVMAGAAFEEDLLVGVDPTLLSSGAIRRHRLVAAGPLKP
jgi:hypothetical protein